MSRPVHELATGQKAKTSRYVRYLLLFASVGITLGLLLSAVPTGESHYGWPMTVWMSSQGAAFLGFSYWNTRGTWSLEQHWDFLRYDARGIFIAAIELHGLIFNLALGVICGLVAYAGVRRYLFRIKPGHCRCGYDLTGNVSGRCPECGRKVSAAGPAAGA